MIYSLSANKPSFNKGKSLPFHAGLNIILGMKSENSGAKDTRNSLGKSTVLNLIDFCLGADILPELTNEKLSDWSFTIDIDIGGSRVKVTRALLEESRDLIEIEGDVTKWPIPPDTPAINGGTSKYGIENWRKLLGAVFFSLPIHDVEVPIAEKPPSYRGLMGFFHRKSFQGDLTPSSANESSTSRDRTLAYLLGLEWEFVSRYSALTAQEKDAKTIRDAATIKREEWHESSIRTLEGTCKRLKTDLDSIRSQLSEFKVDPLYHQSEEEADRLTRELHKVRRSFYSNRRALFAATQSLRDDFAESDGLKELYEEAGIAFPDAIVHTLDEVAQFHRDVVLNRRRFLEEEIKQLKALINQEESKLEQLDKERSECLKHLGTHGALEEFASLQDRSEKLVSELSAKMQCLNDLKKSRSDLKKIKNDKAAELSSAKDEFDHRSQYAESASATYRALTESLYEESGAGTFEIDFLEKPNTGKKSAGFRFKTSLPSSGGAGKGKINLYAVDMTIFKQQSLCKRNISLMLHDGEIFTSADERQVATALELAHKYALERDGQYITGFNDDKLPTTQFSQGFNIEDCIALRLYDGAVENKLLGIEF